MEALAIDKTRTAQGGDWREVLERLGPDLEAEGRLCDAQGRFVSANLDRLADEGFFAMGVPAELGGGGASYPELCAMLRSLGRWCGSTALALSMHSHQVAVAAWRWKHQKAPTDALLRRVAGEGLRLVSSGGSDWLPGSGVAEKVDGGFRISGRKVFGSGSEAGGVLMTCAVYDDPEAGPTVLHFGMPLGVEGVTVLDTWDTLGMRGTASQDIKLKDVFIADAAVSGRREAGKWHMLFHIISMIAFPLIYSAYAGVADGARTTAIGLAGRKAPDTLAILGVGEMETAHTALDVAWNAMVALGEAGAPGPETTNRTMALRTLAGRAALEMGERALECAGGAGFYRAAGLEQRFRDLQGARYHPLQERPQQLYAGRLALGLPIDG